MNRQFDPLTFGLEPRDLRVYETMLANAGGISVRSLAEAVNMNRGTTFEVIKKLVQLGLVTSHYKLSRKYYVAQPPAQLQALAHEKYTAMGTELQALQDYAEALKVTNAADPAGRFSQLYEGEEEIALLLHDVLGVVSRLPEKKYRVISSAEMSSHLYPKFANFTRQRIRLGITAHAIGIGGQPKMAAPLSERKVLTTDESPACYILIYGDKVAQISMNTRNDVQGSVVENEGVAKLYKLLFDQLWDRL